MIFLRCVAIYNTKDAISAVAKFTHDKKHLAISDGKPGTEGTFTVTK